MEFVLLVVAVLVVAAIAVAAGAMDRTRRVARRTRVVERPVREVVVERPVREVVVEREAPVRRVVDEP